MPDAREFIANNRTEEEVRQAIGADWLVYQDLQDLIESVRKGNPEIKSFDTSCFSGDYVTGDISMEYLTHLQNHRNEQTKSEQNPEETVIGLYNTA